MIVYVRWYGKVLEGDLLDGESMGMKQVRIPLDGHHPIALFAPGHVYNSKVEAMTGHEEFDPAEAKNKAVEVSINQHPYTNIPYHPVFGPIIPVFGPIIPEPVCNLIELKLFKQANWDHERNHLRTDKLDEFYQLWRKVMVPSGYVEAEASNILPSNNPVSKPGKLPDKISNKPADQKPSKKMLRSAGQQQFTDSTQLALFE